MTYLILSIHDRLYDLSPLQPIVMTVLMTYRLYDLSYFFNSWIINEECVNIKNFIWFLSLYVILSAWSNFQAKRANIEHYSISIINSLLVLLIIHENDVKYFDISF